MKKYCPKVYPRYLHCQSFESLSIMILVPEFPYITYNGTMVPVACGDGVANRSCPADEE